MLICSNIVYNGKKVISLLTIGLFIAVCLMPGLQSDSNFEWYDKLKNCKENNQKTEYFSGCVPIIYGRISNPRIEKQGSKKWLWFHAEVVHVIESYYSYFGFGLINQWVYSEEVRLNLKTDGPEFRGIVTNNFILGRQISRYF